MNLLLPVTIRVISLKRESDSQLYQDQICRTLSSTHIRHIINEQDHQSMKGTFTMISFADIDQVIKYKIMCLV